MTGPSIPPGPPATTTTVAAPTAPPTPTRRRRHKGHDYSPSGEAYIPRDYGTNPPGFGTSTWDTSTPSNPFLPPGGSPKRARRARAQHQAIKAISRRFTEQLDAELAAAKLNKSTWNGYALGYAWFNDEANFFAMSLLATFADPPAPTHAQRPQPARPAPQPGKGASKKRRSRP